MTYNERAMSWDSRLGLALCLVAACAQGAAAAGERPEAPRDAPDQDALRDLWGRDFAEPPKPAAVQAALRRLRESGHDANSLGKLLRTETAYSPIGAGWHSAKVRVADGAKTYDVPFVLHVPRSYRPERAHPLLLAAHGQGSSGRHIAQIVLRLLGRDAENYLLLAPTLPGPRHFSGRAYQEQAYLKPLGWARRRLHVDGERICLAGYSQGGHLTWHLATLFARHVAAGVSMAGTPWFEGSPHTNTLYLENLANVRFWALWGDRDRPRPPALGQVDFCRAATRRLKELGNTNYKPAELRGVGHGGCWPSRRDFVAFLATARRTPVPPKLTHVFHLDHHRRGYYLEAVDLAGKPMRMDRPIRIKFRPRGDDPNGDKAAESYFRKYLFKMWADLDRKKNELRIRTSRVRSVRIYVTEGMFDLSRPVTLRFGSRAWRGRIEPSAECMLLHHAAERDAGAIVLNEIDFRATGRAAVRYR